MWTYDEIELTSRVTGEENARFFKISMGGGGGGGGVRENLRVFSRARWGLLRPSVFFVVSKTVLV